MGSAGRDPRGEAAGHWSEVDQAERFETAQFNRQQSGIRQPSGRDGPEDIDVKFGDHIVVHGCGL